jgi:hypothetical protein
MVKPEKKPAEVITPFGPAKPENSHKVPSGSLIIEQKDLTEVFGPNKEKILTLPKAVSVKAPSRKIRPYGDWIEWASDDVNSREINYFKAEWSIPTSPSGDGTVFLFNGLCPPSLEAIVQPVLQWGKSAAGGGRYWAVASWYVWLDQSGEIKDIHSELMDVREGENLAGIITKSGYMWSIEIQKGKGVGPKPKRSISVQSSFSYPWPCIALEGYNIDTLGELPGRTIFTNLQLKIGGGKFMPSWMAHIDDEAKRLFPGLRVSTAGNRIELCTGR